MTDMGAARNNINAISSDIIVAIGINAGISSEISLALQPRASKPVILLNPNKETKTFFKMIRSELVHTAETATEVIKIAKQLLKK